MHQRARQALKDAEAAQQRLGGQQARDRAALAPFAPNPAGVTVAGSMAGHPRGLHPVLALHFETGYPKYDCEAALKHCNMDEGRAHNFLMGLKRSQLSPVLMRIELDGLRERIATLEQQVFGARSK